MDKLPNAARKHLRPAICYHTASETRIRNGTLGAHLVRRSVWRNGIAADQPQLVNVAEKHGARKLLGAFERMAEANVFYMNLPYGAAGAYIWI